MCGEGADVAVVYLDEHADAKATAKAGTAALTIGMISVTQLAQAATVFSANFEDGSINAWSSASLKR